VKNCRCSPAALYPNHFWSLQSGDGAAALGTVAAISRRAKGAHSLAGDLLPVGDVLEHVRTDQVEAVGRDLRVVNGVPTMGTLAAAALLAGRGGRRPVDPAAIPCDQQEVAGGASDVQTAGGRTRSMRSR